MRDIVRVCVERCGVVVIFIVVTGGTRKGCFRVHHRLILLVSSRVGFWLDRSVVFGGRASNWKRRRIRRHCALFFGLS